MVEAAFGQPRLLTNRIHRRGRVAARQEQFLRRRQNPLLRLVSHHDQNEYTNQSV